MSKHVANKHKHLPIFDPTFLSSFTEFACVWLDGSKWFKLKDNPNLRKSG